MRKCKCGNAVARNARNCPKCGHRFTSAPVKLVAWVFAVVLGVGFIGALVGTHTQNSDAVQSAPSPAEQAAKQKEDGEFQFAVMGAKQLHDSMRNPDSFKLGETLIMSDGATCYDYRAQNGFGGMNVGHAVLSPTGQF
jgi:hypothetical protein